MTTASRIPARQKEKKDTLALYSMTAAEYGRIVILECYYEFRSSPRLDGAQRRHLTQW